MIKKGTCSILLLISILSCNFSKKEVTYDEKGNIITDCAYRKDELDSTCRKYYTNGALKNIISWRNGKKQDTAFYFAQTGELIATEIYQVGFLTGQNKEFYTNGKISVIREMKDGKINGRVIYFYSDGNIKQDGNYLNSRPTGIHYKYDSIGRIAEKCEYVLVEGKSMLNKKIVFDSNGNIDSLKSEFFAIEQIKSKDLKHLCFKVKMINPPYKNTRVIMGVASDFVIYNNLHTDTFELKSPLEGIFSYQPSSSDTTIYGFINNENHFNRDSSRTIRRFYFSVSNKPIG